MATIPVKFHSVTAERYSQIQSPDAGSLYFISDNGEIRKGSQHITGTRVYTAVDPTNGATPLANLTILLNGSAPGANDQPKKGDILVVDQTLKAGVPASGTEGQEGYVPAVPAVIAKAAYAHNGTDWEACDGNVDASKVILTQNITMAGNYDKIGNFNKGTGTNATPLEGNKGTAGVSVYELIRQMLSKTNEPTWKRNPPTVSINTPSAGTKEYGATATVTWTATFNKAYAQYDGGSTQNANNTPTYRFDSDAGISGNTKQKSWTAGVDTPPSTSVTVDYTASTNVPTNNLGVASTTINPQTIAAGTTNTASSQATITVIRNWFYKVDTDGTGAIDSTLIRSGVAGGNCETASNSVEFTVGSGVKRIIVAIPQVNSSDPCTNAAKTLTDVYATHLGPTASIMSEYKKMESTVQVADARQGGQSGMIAYDVWVYQPASIGATEVHKYIIG